MRERNFDIATADGKMDTFITHPDEGGPFPAVIIYMDAPGIREELYDFARRVGTVGYYCMVPDLYYRQGRVRFDRKHMDEAQRAEMFAVMGTLSNGLIMDDTRAMLDFMSQGEPVRPGPKGSIGYCMSGQFVLSAAGTFPEEFRATASLHGVKHVTAQPDSPHLLTEKFRGEMYLGFAEDDPHVPLAEVEALRESLTGTTVKHTIEVHPGTEHGYTFPERQAFQKEAAERSWERIFAMFHRQIRPGE
ncbi:MAG: dienelactone hydrolase family protein [SAR324 cluster bacterium]|nr:dienelactone hydrolase family protein [SAR324 cluster bacterium]